MWLVEVLVLIIVAVSSCFATETITATVLAVTPVGGAGDQAINRVAWSDCNTVVGIASDNSFTISYSTTGSLIGVTGNINVVGTVPTTFLVTSTSESSAQAVPNPSDAAGNTYLSAFYEQVSSNSQAPRLRLYRTGTPKNRANALIQSYRTYYASSISALPGNRGDCRGFDVIPLPYGKVAWRVWGDDGAGNVRDPRDIKAGNCACRTPSGTNLCSSKGSTFFVGQMPLSFNAQIKPLYGRNHGFRPETWLADDDGRFIISTDETTGGTDPLGLGGRPDCGITIYDQSLQTRIYVARFGCYTIHSIASKGNLLVIGGRINSTQIASLNSAGKLTNAYQTAAGGGYDGFFAIIRLNINGTPDPLPATQCTDCYCNATQVDPKGNCSLGGSGVIQCFNYPPNTPISAGQNLGFHNCSSHGPFKVPYPSLTGNSYAIGQVTGSSVNASATNPDRGYVYGTPTTTA